MTKLVTLVIVTMVICGCLPARYTYYQPMAKDERLVNSLPGSVALKMQSNSLQMALRLELRRGSPHYT
jgi:hypothetical protein